VGLFLIAVLISGLKLGGVKEFSDKEIARCYNVFQLNLVDRALSIMCCGIRQNTDVENRYIRTSPRPAVQFTQPGYGFSGCRPPPIEARIKRHQKGPEEYETIF
jgi:hypothetical protein